MDIKLFHDTLQLLCNLLSQIPEQLPSKADENLQ